MIYVQCPNISRTIRQLNRIFIAAELLQVFKREANIHLFKQRIVSSRTDVRFLDATYFQADHSRLLRVRVVDNPNMGLHGHRQS